MIGGGNGAARSASNKSVANGLLAPPSEDLMRFHMDVAEFSRHEATIASPWTPASRTRSPPDGFPLLSVFRDGCLPVRRRAHLQQHPNPRGVTGSRDCLQRVINDDL